MSAHVTHFLKVLRNRNAASIATQLRRMGLYIKDKADRADLMKAIDALDLQIVEQYLSKSETAPVKQISKVNMQPVYDPLLLPLQLATLRESLIQVHQKYLNQFGKQQIPISAQSLEKERRRSSVDEVNDLLGISPEIRLDPKSIIHQYEHDNATLTSEIFPTLDSKQYELRLYKYREILRYVDGPDAQSKLLIAYGIEKQKKFYLSSIDYIQQLLYPNKPVKLRLTAKYRPIQLMRGLLTTFPQRQQYYLAVLGSLSVVQLYKFITIINAHLSSIDIAPVTIHSFSIALSEVIISKSPILRTTTLTINSKAILDWITQSIKKFRTFLQLNEIQRSSVNALLITLKRYSHIRRVFSQHIDQLPEEVLLQASQREWIQAMLVKLETAVDEVSVGELGGRRVAQKLQSVKILIKFVASEQVELSQAFLQKILVSIRNGLDALLGQEQNKHQNSLFISQKQRIFGKEVCGNIIKLMFMNVEVSIDVAPVVSFLWSTFCNVPTLDQASIQSLFLLINVTTRYKCEAILKKQENAVFDLLKRSLEIIGREDYQQLRKKQVIDFLKEQAVLLLGTAKRETLLQMISLNFE